MTATFLTKLRRTNTKRPAHYGDAFMINYTADDDQPKFDAYRDFITRPIKDPIQSQPERFHPPPSPHH